MDATETELLYLRDAYTQRFDATVVDRRDGALALDRTAFYPTGGGQPTTPACSPATRLLR